MTTAPETPDTDGEINDPDVEPTTEPAQGTVDPTTTLATVTYPSDGQAKAVKIAELVRDLASLIMVDDPAPSLAALERLTEETEDLTDPAEREWTRTLLAHLRVGVRMAEERTLGTEDPEPFEEPEAEDDRDIPDEDDLAATAPPAP